MTTLGAITWAWHFSDTRAGTQYDGEQQILSPAAAEHLRPYFVTRTGTNTVDVDPPSQAMMDKMLAMCVACGLDYLAFVYSPAATGYLAPSGGLDCARGNQDALTYFLASPYSKQIKFCLICIGGDMGVAWPAVPGDWPTVQADLLSWIDRPEYFKLTDGRPLVYFYGTAEFNTRMGGTGTTKMNAVRTALNSLGYPFNGMCLVDMTGGGTANLGADAVSAYTTFLSGSGSPVAYSTYAAQSVSEWNAWYAAGRYTIPLVSTGWDIRARVATPFWDDTLGTGIGRPPLEATNTDYTDGTVTTAAAIANQIKTGIEWDASHTSLSLPMDSVLIYALNEFTESGNGMLPMAQHTGEPVLQVVARTLRRQKDSHTALKARGMPIVNHRGYERAYL